MGLVARLLEPAQLSMAVQALPFAPVVARPLLAGAGLAVDVLGDPFPGMADGPKLRRLGQEVVHVAAPGGTPPAFGAGDLGK